MRNLTRMLLVMLAMLMVASSAHAANLAPVQVFSDPAGDNVTNEDVSPAAAADLTAGFIGETDSALTFTWQVASIDDTIASTGLPQPDYYYWEMSLAAPSGATGLFSVRVRTFPTAGTGGVAASYPAGSLQGNCTTTGTLVTCTPVVGANVTVSVDATADTITATVPRSSLKSNDGQALAVDGATLDDAKLFNGTAACVSFVVITSSAACDTATLDDTYVLGSPR